MNTTRIPYPLNEIKLGFLAPVDSLKFFRRNKILLFMCLAIHVVAFSGYVWSVAVWISPHLSAWIQNVMGSSAGAFLGDVLHALASFSLFVFAILLYGIVMVPLVNVLASPLFDLVAERAYFANSGIQPPKLSFRYLISSMFFEFLKVLFLVGIVIVTFLSSWLLLLGPLVFLLSLWFLGWDQIDRTLSVMGLPFRRRLGFGLQHMVACVALGVWFFVPFLGSVLSFCMIPAGSLIAVALQSARDMERVRAKQQKGKK